MKQALMSCKETSAAKKSYQRDLYRLMAVYAVILVCSCSFLRHHVWHHVMLYFWAILPSLPIVAMIWRMGRYLKEEADEYQRLLLMQAILVATAALLAMLIINDFVRAFAKGAPWPPFTCFIAFCLALAITQAIQKLRDGVSGDD